MSSTWPRLKGTAIKGLFQRNQYRGHASPRPSFLEITYPTHNLLKAIAAVGPDKAVRWL